MPGFNGSGDVSRDVYDGGMVGTQNVIDAINASGSVRRIVYTSSMAAVSDGRAATMPKATNGPRRTGRPTVWTRSAGRARAMPIRLGTELAGIIHEYFPSYVLGKPATVTSQGEPITLASNMVNDCKKAKEVLGATIRPVEDTLRAVVETSVELGIIDPQVSQSA